MKKLVFVVVSLLLVLGLVACSSANQSNNNNATTPGQSDKVTDSGSSDGEKIMLRYYTSGRHDIAIFEEYIEKFNQTNTDNIEVEFVGMSENYQQSVDIAFSSGQAPDLLRVNDQTFEPFYKKNYLEPLNDYMTDELTKKFDGLFNEGINQVDGQIYSLPNDGRTYRLIYNQEIFEQVGLDGPPKTLAELVDYADRITQWGKDKNIYGFAQNFKNPKASLERSAAPIVALSGHNGFGFNFQTGRFDFGGYKEVMLAFKEMYDNGSMLPGSESLDIDPLRAQFAEGNIGMYFSFSVEPGVYKDQFPTDIKWAAAIPPTIDGEAKSSLNLTAAGTFISISSESKHKDAAWKFLEFLAQDEFLTDYHEGGYGLSLVPSIQSTANEPDIYGMDGFLMTKYDTLWPVPPTVVPEGRNYTDTFFRFMIEGGDIDQIIEELSRDYNEALDKAIANGEVSVEPDPSFDPSQLISN